MMYDLSFPHSYYLLKINSSFVNGLTTASVVTVQYSLDREADLGHWSRRLGNLLPNTSSANLLCLYYTGMLYDGVPEDRKHLSGLDLTKAVQMVDDTWLNYYGSAYNEHYGERLYRNYGPYLLMRNKELDREIISRDVSYTFEAQRPIDAYMSWAYGRRAYPSEYMVEDIMSLWHRHPEIWEEMMQEAGPVPDAYASSRITEVCNPEHAHTGMLKQRQLSYDVGEVRDRFLESVDILNKKVL